MPTPKGTQVDILNDKDSKWPGSVRARARSKVLLSVFFFFFVRNPHIIMTISTKSNLNLRTPVDGTRLLKRLTLLS